MATEHPPDPELVRRASEEADAILARRRLLRPRYLPWWAQWGLVALTLIGVVAIIVTLLFLPWWLVVGAWLFLAGLGIGNAMRR